ncbi:MAG: 50S ribosomal protein L24 [Bacteroidia bacterium]|nr:50S ribosomal protein L24 [Bacteroidia bacterium]
MAKKFRIRKGDQVEVITGVSRGKKGKVISVNREKVTALVEGINMVSRHTKPTSKNPQGGIIKKEAPIHLSNLMLIDGAGNATRVGKRRDEKTNKLVRFSKKTNEVIA